jgi:sulfoxide reductase heme-binding subunit YedZ
MTLTLDPHLWWYLSRATGTVAWVMLTASVLWGIVLASDLFPKWRRNATILAMHRWMAGLTLFFIAGHLATLLLDSYTHFRPADFVVPYASVWRPTAVAVGVVALWSLVAVELTALGMKRLSKTWWRMVHIAGYFVFWGVSVHAALAGTDASKPVYVVSAIAALALVTFAASYRALSHHLPRRRPAGAEGRARA